MLLDSLRTHGGALRRDRAPRNSCATWPIAFAPIRARVPLYDSRSALPRRRGLRPRPAPATRSSCAAARSRAFHRRRAVRCLPHAGRRASVEFEPAIGPAAPDRYVITLRWRGARDARTTPTPSRCRCWRSAGGGLSVRASRARGFNLPELMIALALGLVLLAAFLAVLQRCRGQFRGQRKPGAAAGRRAPGAVGARARHRTRRVLWLHAAIAPRAHARGTVLADAARCASPTAGTRAGAGLPAGAHDCGINFAVDLELRQGSNNAFALGSDARDCAPTATAGGARAGSDTLTLRHASLDTVAPHAGRLQLYSRRSPRTGPLAAVRRWSRARAGRCRCRGARPRSAQLLHREQFGGSPADGRRCA